MDPRGNICNHGCSVFMDSRCMLVRLLTPKETHGSSLAKIEREVSVTIWSHKVGVENTANVIP